MGTVEALEETARAFGADLFGICSLSGLQGIETVPEDLFAGFASAVGIGVALDSAAVDSISADGPSPAYAEEYRKANEKLDEIAGALAKALAAAGRKALAIPASQTLDQRRELGAISHRAAARAAGLGWIGKNLLLVTSRFGPRVRLVTILTDLSAPKSLEMEPGCGDCTACIDACPAKALSEPPRGAYPPVRGQVLDVAACRRQCEVFAQEEEIGAHVCGVCIKACPAAPSNPRAGTSRGAYHNMSP